ncbi:hypothetical protein Tco_1433052 [Tanacetum coccineum]
MHDKMKDPECVTPDKVKIAPPDFEEQTSASIPTKALTVYPPNTHATLVPRVLPTKSQALIKEVKEIFEELLAEVDQHVIDRKHDEIEQKNLLIVNHLNLQLKYQNLKESFGNDTSPPTRDVPDFD